MQRSVSPSPATDLAEQWERHSLYLFQQWDRRIAKLFSQCNICRRLCSFFSTRVSSLSLASFPLREREPFYSLTILSPRWFLLLFRPIGLPDPCAVHLDNQLGEFVAETPNQREKKTGVVWGSLKVFKRSSLVTVKGQCTYFIDSMRSENQHLYALPTRQWESQRNWGASAVMSSSAESHVCRRRRGCVCTLWFLIYACFH